VKFVHGADYQMVDDFARAQLKSIEGFVRKVTLTSEGTESIGRLGTELLALVGEAQLMRDNGGRAL
jgi:hypothetical protein